KSGRFWKSAASRNELLEVCRFRGFPFDIQVESESGDKPGSQINQKEKAMRFLSIYKTVERTTPPTQEEMASMGKLVEEGMKAGWLIATEGCLPSALGVRVRRDSGKISVTDGPF